MKRKITRTLAFLLSFLLLLGTVTPAFATTAPTEAEEQSTIKSTLKPKLTIKVKTDKKIYGIDEEIVFKITVTNIGLGDAERVYVETKSHKHLDLDDDQKTIIFGDLAAGESKTMELYGRYMDETNATLLSNLLLKTVTPLYEFFFTLYATIYIPLFGGSNVSYSEVNFVDEYEGIDKDYGVLAFAKYTTPANETTTEADNSTEPTEPTDPAEPTDPTDPFEVFYTVSFDSNGGSAVDAQSVKENDFAVQPEIPTLEDNVFLGWFTDAECTQSYDFNTPVTTDITLYAKWMKVAIIIYNYNYEGSQEPYCVQQIELGTNTTKPMDPTRDAYYFVTWCVDQEGTTAFDFSTAVTENISLYATWSQTGSDDAEDEEDDEVADSDVFVLSANATEVLTASNTTVLFKVNSTLTVSYFELFMNDVSTGVYLYDDGDDDLHFDDIPLDGCYSGVYSINMAEEGDIEFTAKAMVGENTIVTDPYIIHIYQELTDEQIDVMFDLENSLLALIEDAQLTVESDEESIALLKQEIEALLNTAQEQNIIKDIIYHNSLYMFMWTYVETNVDAGVTLLSETESDSDIKSTDAVGVSSNSQYLSLGNELTYSKGNVIIMNNYPAGHSWNVAYDEYAETLEAAGFDVTRIYSFTVADFKNLQNYDSLILVNSHGQTSNGTKTGIPAICTEEQATAATEEAYSYDLANNNIARVNMKYWIYPGLFEDTYKNDKLSGPIVHLGICRGYANDALVKAIYAAGASAVSGYDATVTTTYDEPMVSLLVERLLLGDSANEAWNYARSNSGVSPNYDTDWQDYATLLCYDGDGDTLYHELLNGKFDSTINLDGNDVTLWKTYGDARTIYKLSGLSPDSSPKMAIISSGFGSMGNETTSCIYQTVLVPEGASNISFKYDVVSEEPMEYVGSIYNDIFSADILTTDGELLQNLTYESVNTSTWYSIDGIDFPGGDSTTYHTRWITVSNACMEEYNGQLVVIRFTVKDAGDSIYDTATLIDSVCIY